ncbi:hypothetical protein [Vibrio phage J14]|nr:hypothetical protein [Vibrio phage J14]
MSEPSKITVSVTWRYLTPELKTANPLEAVILKFVKPIT